MGTLNLNTTIPQMVVFVNGRYKAENIYVEYAKGFTKMFAYFALHTGEEIWNTVFGGCGTTTYEPWSTYDEAKLVEDVIKVTVQVNGRLREKFTMEAGSDEEAMRRRALEISAVVTQVEGRAIRRIIIVKGKVASIATN